MTMNGLVSDKKQRLAQQFGKSAKRYDEIAQVQLEIGFDAIQRVPLNGANAIDVGCGTGRLTHILAQRFSTVTAIDISAGMIEHARIANQEDKNIHFSVADAECLPFLEGHFDFLFSSMVLQWCDPLTASFSEAYRVLKPGGSGLIALLSEGSLHQLQCAWQRLEEPQRVNQFLSHQNILNELKAVGFDVTHQLKNYTTFHSNLRCLLNSIRHVGASTLPTEGGMPMLTRAKMRQLDAIYSDEFATADGLPLSYTVSFLSVNKPL